MFVLYYFIKNKIFTCNTIEIINMSNIYLLNIKINLNLLVIKVYVIII